jgi:phospholipid/cholesterol/gamma-HCH transport system permease protein
MEGLGRIALLGQEAMASIFRRKVAWRDVLFQIYFMGVRSQSVVLITGAFTGMVLCAQTYMQFHKVKMDTASLAVVGVSMCSELGPVLTGLMVAGRVGAAIAAEIGTMRVTEQIDALRTLATHPVDYLVVPRLMAAHIALPLLTAEAMCIGIAGGFVVGAYYYGVPANYLWENMIRYTGSTDVFVGLTKAFF